MTRRWRGCAALMLIACGTDATEAPRPNDAGVDVIPPGPSELDAGEPPPWVPPQADAGPCVVQIKASVHDRAGRPMTASLAGARPGSSHRWTIEEATCLEALPALDYDNLTFTPTKAGCTLHISVTEEGFGQSCSDSAIVHVDFADAVTVDFASPTPATHEAIDKLAAALPQVRAAAPEACGGRDSTTFCPQQPTTRGVMAATVVGAKDGPKYTPPACSGSARTFLDVPAARPDCPWIEELARRGVVGGCGGGNYCPDTSVTRAQMALFLLKTKEGSSYSAPPCTGVTRMFADVPESNGFCSWIEELARRGITGGCGGNNYCPDNPVTREQSSVFVVGAFAIAFPKDVP